MDQLSENPSLLSDISTKQQKNYSKLKQHSDFLANFIRDNNISINDNPSVESKIMDTPQRQDIIGIKQGQGRSALISPQTQRTYQDVDKRNSNRIQEERDYLPSDNKRRYSPNINKKYDEVGDNQREDINYQRLQQNQQYDIDEDGSIQQESQNEFDGDNESQGNIHKKGTRVIKEIDNIFDKIKTKYNIDFSLKEMQKHLNIPDSTAGNSENPSRQHFDGLSQEDFSINPSFINQNQKQIQRQQEILSYDYEANPDSIIQRIRNKVMNIQGNNQPESQNEQFQTQKQTRYMIQQSQDDKERQIENKRSEIKKKLSPGGSSKNPISQIDEHNADLEIERIKTRIQNRNSELKRQADSPLKDQQANNQQRNDKENKSKEETEKKQSVQDEQKTQKKNKDSYKHPLYSSSDSDEEIINIPKNKGQISNKTITQKNKEILPDINNNDRQKVGVLEKLEIGEKNNQKQKISQQNSKSDKSPIKNLTSGKLEDESIKALESISQNKINFKENFKKLKQIFKNNFDVQKCREDDRIEKEAQQTRKNRNENLQFYQQDYRVQTQSDDQQGDETNLEYSQDHQQDILFPTLNPYHQEEDFSQGNQNLVNNHQVDSYFYGKDQHFNKQQYNLSGDEGGDMDSEVFNISPEHHPHHGSRLNSIPDDNRTLSIFNENQSLQASFLEQSIFQRSPRQIQSGNNSTIQQPTNRKNNFISPPVHNNQMQENNHHTNSQQSMNTTNNQRNTFNHQSQSSKNISLLSADNQPQFSANSQKQINQNVNQGLQVKNNQQSSYQLESFQQNNNSNLSYSQSIHDQSSIYQNDPKKQFYGEGIMIGERILPLIEEEDERYQQLYDKDPIIQKLFQEKNGLESELRKWENILQELNRQSLNLQ